MKYKVVTDELLINKTCVYAILPFEKLDETGSAVFKIGRTENIGRRIENYHTDFVLGCYLVCFLDFVDNSITKFRLIKIEDFIFHRIKELGAKNIQSTTRPKGNEWYYTNINTLHKVFKEAQTIYGGVTFIPFEAH